eukprot:201449_1
MIWNETIGYLIKHDVNQTLQFISWHQFGKFKQKNNGKWVSNFFGAGTVHATFDLIESYTSFINGGLKSKPTKILISEHGLAAQVEMKSGYFNVSYMQYIGAATHLTDVLNFLDRPESQLKTNSFLLTSNSSSREPILLIYPSNGTLTPTSIVYNIWSLLKQNNGNKVNSSIDFDNNINNKTETVKLHA